MQTGNVSDSSIQSDPSRRATDPNWTTDQEVAFADGFPALIVSQVTKLFHLALTFMFEGMNNFYAYACSSSLQDLAYRK